MARNSERHLGFTRSICVRLLNYLLLPAGGGRVGGKGGRRCQSSAKAQYHECLARHVCVCVCVSLSPSLWIRIQIEVTNLNWPQKWLPLFCYCPAPAHFGAAWQKATENKDSPLACVYSVLPYPYPLTCAAFSVVLCTLFALHTLCNTGRRPIR